MTQPAWTRHPDTGRLRERPAWRSGLPRIRWTNEEHSFSAQGEGWAATVVPALAGGWRAQLRLGDDVLAWPGPEAHPNTAEHCRRWVRYRVERLAYDQERLDPQRPDRRSGAEARKSIAGQK